MKTAATEVLRLAVEGFRRRSPWDCDDLGR